MCFLRQIWRLLLQERIGRYRGELFRNIDFIVTDLDYCPVFLIEINDQTHLAQERRERDRKVADICEEAGIPLITFLDKLWRSARLY